MLFEGAEAIDCLVLIPTLAALSLVVAIDIRTQRIPDWLTFGIGVLGLVHAFLFLDPRSAMGHSLFGAIAFGSTFLLVRAAVSRRNNAEALGLGDVKFAVAAGVWLGYEHLPLFLLISSLSTLLYTASMSYAKDRSPIPNAARRIPFGPGLVLATLVILGFQQPIN